MAEFKIQDRKWSKTPPRPELLKLGTITLYLADCGIKFTPTVKNIKHLISKITDFCKFNVKQQYIEKFYPQGLTVVTILQESHLIIQTWDELKKIEIEIASCQEFDAKTLSNYLNSLAEIEVLGECCLQKVFAGEGRIKWKMTR